MGGGQGEWREGGGGEGGGQGEWRVGWEGDRVSGGRGGVGDRVSGRRGGVGGLLWNRSYRCLLYVVMLGIL